MKHKLSFLTLLIAFTFLIGSCVSVKIAYNYADWYLVYKLDDYFNLTDKQEEFLDKKIKRFHQWHRKYQLPQYVTFLKKTKKRLKNGLSQDDVIWIRNRYRKLRNNAAEELSLAIATFLSIVTNAQIKHLEKEFKKAYDRAKKDLKKPSKELKITLAENIIESLEGWFDDLLPKQKKKVHELVHIDKKTLSLDLEYRRKANIRFIKLLKARKKPKQIEAQIREWFLKPALLRNSEYNNLIKKRRKKGHQILFIVDQLVTKKQRQHALDKLQGYIDDISDLTK
ncbi:MAG: hypothetical protein ACI86H_002953 [bacterium]|jgi:hypothetical protein